MLFFVHLLVDVAQMVQKSREESEEAKSLQKTLMPTPNLSDLYFVHPTHVLLFIGYTKTNIVLLDYYNIFGALFLSPWQPFLTS